MSELDFENPHYCPVYDKVIDIDLCYETLMCLNRSFKISYNSFFVMMFSLS